MVQIRILLISIILVILCIAIELPLIFLPIYIIMEMILLFKRLINYTNTNIDEVTNNLYEELEDENTQEHYKNDINDISQEEIHEHREDFWNNSDPIDYK